MSTDAPEESHRLTVAGADPELDQQLSAELTWFNQQVTDVTDQREFTVRANDGDGSLLAGLSGWTWGTCAGIALVWVREDRRHQGLGAQLLGADLRSSRQPSKVVEILPFRANFPLEIDH